MSGVDLLVFLAEQIKTLESAPIRDGKQIGVTAACRVADEIPVRNREHVVLRPAEVCSPTVDWPLPDTTRHIMLQVVRFGRVGFFRSTAHRVAIEHRHHRPAGCGIGVTQSARAVVTDGQRGQQPPRRRTGIAVFGRMRRRGLGVGP